MQKTVLAILLVGLALSCPFQLGQPLWVELEMNGSCLNFGFNLEGDFFCLNSNSYVQRYNPTDGSMTLIPGSA